MIKAGRQNRLNRNMDFEDRLSGMGKWSFYVCLMVRALKSYAPLVQLVEHPTFNRRVAGSNPVWGIRPFRLVAGHRTLTLAGLVRFQQRLF